MFVLGLRIAPDYGLYIDEFTNHYFGVRWYNYASDVIVHHAPLAPMANATEHDVVHGPIFEMALAFIEQAVLHLTDIRQIVLFRHQATWALFCLGVGCFYCLAQRLFASRALAGLACAFLVVHPRIFSHAFYDSVDIPFLVLYAASLCTLMRYLDRRTAGALCLHALACAVLIDIRSLGGLIPAITVVLLMIDLLKSQNPSTTRLRHLGKIVVYLAVLTLATIIFWPYLWTNPWARALDVIRQSSKVDWAGLVLYRGHEILTTKLPWHYIPLWILITTPLVYSGFFVVGLIDSLVAFCRNPAACCRERVNGIVILAALLLPVLAVIALHAIVFDSWRHLFFIYPAIVLVSIAGVRRTFAGIAAGLRGRPRLVCQVLVAALLATNLATTGWFMVRNHPYQNVYFNRLAGKNMQEIKRRFEMDYWGLSYLRALKYVLQHDPADPIKIFHGDTLLAINRLVLPPADQARIKSVGFAEAEYVLTNYRQARNGYPELPEYFSIKVEGENILCVYRKVPQNK